MRSWDNAVDFETLFSVFASEEIPDDTKYLIFCRIPTYFSSLVMFPFFKELSMVYS